MPKEAVSSPPLSRTDRVPPYSEEAEKGVLGSVLLDAARVMDLCVANQLTADSFYIPAHRTVFDALVAMWQSGQAIDVLTTAEFLKGRSRLESIGGTVALDRLIDATPTAAHAEYYVDIVRQKHLLRAVIDCVRSTESECYGAEDSADLVLSRAEERLLKITEGQHGTFMPWPEAVKETMAQVERILDTRRGLTGLSTGFANLDGKIQGLRGGEMIVLAARPSMGKTSLAMNIAERVATGTRDPDHQGRAVGIFSLEMSRESLVMRMLCSHAEVSAFRLNRGILPTREAHGKLTTAASVLSKAPIYLDDTGGLDVMELRARARRLKQKNGIELIVIDYLQLLHAREYARQGRQIETAAISGDLKAMAKELNVPVLVLSQLSRAPEQRDRLVVPKLSDLRDSGAIEQDADVVCMLRRPCKYPDDDEAEDLTLAVVDVAKQRNGPTGDVRLNFVEEYLRFEDRAVGVDPSQEAAAFVGAEQDVEA